MTPERYQKILHWLNAHPTAKQLVILLNHWLPAVPFVCYPVLLVLLNLQWFQLLRGGLDQTALDFMQCIARAILVPGFVFPRPYEQPGFTPLVEKETHGQSFPSRHALSAAVLAAVWLSFYPAVGGFMVAVTVAICVLRVLAGVHFPRDVIAGALLGFSLGIVGMRLL